MASSADESFADVPPLNRNIPIAWAAGDAYNVEKIAQVLDHRPWSEVTWQQLTECGAGELMHYMTSEGFAYYLPAMMSGALRNSSPLTRLHEVISMMLMPAAPRYAHVWEQFWDGQFEAPTRTELPGWSQLIWRGSSTSSMPTHKSSASVSRITSMFTNGDPELLSCSYKNFWAIGELTTDRRRS